MTDEKTNESNDKGKEDNKSNETTDKPLNIVDEARAIRDEIRKEREKLKEENERREKIHSEELLAGTSGANVVSKPKEETSKEYRDRIDKEMNEGKTDDFN